MCAELRKTFNRSRSGVPLTRLRMRRWRTARGDGRLRPCLRPMTASSFLPGLTRRSHPSPPDPYRLLFADLAGLPGLPADAAPGCAVARALVGLGLAPAPAR